MVQIPPDHTCFTCAYLPLFTHQSFDLSKQLYAVISCNRTVVMALVI